MSNTQPFPFVSTDSVVEDILRGFGLYTCGPDESAGWLEMGKPAPSTSLVYGTVMASYRTQDTNHPYPFTEQEIAEIRQKIRSMFEQNVKGLQIYDIELERGDFPCIFVHWKTARPFSQVINEAREALALIETSNS